MKRLTNIPNRIDPRTTTTVRYIRRAMPILCLAALAWLASNAPAQTVDLKKGLIAYYPFNGNANDESGNGNHFTLLNGVELTNDKAGNSQSAVRITSQDSYAQTSKNVGIHGNSARSVFFWVNLTQETVWPQGWVLGWGKAAKAKELFTVGAFSHENGHISTSGHYADLISEAIGNKLVNEWHHVGIIYNGKFTTSSIYLDGDKLSATQSHNDTLETIDSPLFIGDPKVPVGTNSHHGTPGMLVDEIRIYNRALSEAEVVALHELESTPDPEEGLFGGRILVLKKTSGYARVVQDGQFNAGIYTFKMVCNSDFVPEKNGLPEFFRKIPTNASDPERKAYTTKKITDGIYEHTRKLVFKQSFSGAFVVSAIGLGSTKLPIEFYVISLKNSSGTEILKNSKFKNDEGWKAEGGEISYKKKPANPDYVAMYYFNGNAEDSSGHEIHLAATNVTYGKGRNNESNSAIVFNGNNSQLKITDNIFGNLNKFTATFWVKFNSFRGLPNEWNTLIGGKASLMADKTRIVFFADNYASQGQKMTGNFNFNTGVWYKIELIRNGGDFSIAVNNNVIINKWDRPDRDPGNIGAGSDYFGYFGVGNGGYTLHGSIDEILISNKAKIINPPKITNISNPQTIDEGKSLKLTVVATGSGLITYQWFRNGSAIPGATQSSYYVSRVNESDAGRYKVTVSNAAGNKTSSEIKITINPDTDNDGLLDKLERQIGSDINKTDTDGDGLGDYMEYHQTKTSLLKSDTDGDGLPDGVEVANGFDPNNPSESADGSIFINTAVGLEFFTLKPNRYRLQYSSNLTNWHNDGGTFNGVGGYSKTYRDADSATKYWRLKILN